MSTFSHTYSVPSDVQMTTMQPQVQYVVQQMPQVQSPVPQPSYPHTITVKIVHTEQGFKTGLCDCCVDVGGCLKGCLCPCVVFGKNVEAIKGSECCSHCCCYAVGCGPCNHSPYRRMLRMKYDIPAEPCNDFCVATMCPCCALCQESREIALRENEDRKVGYQGAPQRAMMI